jgi:hypothetical protein
MAEIGFDTGVPKSARVHHCRAWEAHEADSTPQEQYWLPSDAKKRDEHLRRLLRAKRESINNHVGMFCSPYDPGLGAMLCLPRDEVHARMHKLVSGISMVYGLVLSGVAKSALNPFDVAKDFGDDPYKRSLANFYNLAAVCSSCTHHAMLSFGRKKKRCRCARPGIHTQQRLYCVRACVRSCARTFAYACVLETNVQAVQFVLCLSGSLFSTIVFIVISYQPDSTIFQIACRFDFFLAYCYMIFYSSFLLLAQIGSVIYIRSDPIWSHATIGIISVIFVVLFNHFAYGFKKAFPNFAVHQFPIFAMASFNPYVWLWMWGARAKEHKEMMMHNADIMIQEAENNFGVHVCVYVCIAFTCMCV